MPRALFLVLLFCLPGRAGEETLPLHPDILSARFYYVENETGSARVADEFYKELKKAFGLKLAETSKDADILFRLKTYEADESTKLELTVENQTGAVLWRDSRAWTAPEREQQPLRDCSKLTNHGQKRECDKYNFFANLNNAAAAIPAVAPIPGLAKSLGKDFCKRFNKQVVAKDQ